MTASFELFQPTSPPPQCLHITGDEREYTREMKSTHSELYAAEERNANDLLLLNLMLKFHRRG